MYDRRGDDTAPTSIIPDPDDKSLPFGDALDTYPEAVVDRIWTTKFEQDTTYWLLADACLEWQRWFGCTRKITKSPGRHPALMLPIWKWLSAETGTAPRTLLEWARTAQAFPAESRVLSDHLISFHHHRLCAATDDPHGWLKTAMDNDWSTGDLARAIKGGGDDEPCRALERWIYCTTWQKRIDKEECDGCPHRPLARGEPAGGRRAEGEEATQ